MKEREKDIDTVRKWEKEINGESLRKRMRERYKWRIKDIQKKRNVNREILTEKEDKDRETKI